MVGFLAILALSALSAGAGALLGSGASGTVGQVAESAADIAKATAFAIQKEAEMLLPVMRDPHNGFIIDTHDAIPLDAQPDPIETFLRMLSVPAHQLILTTLILNKGAEIIVQALRVQQVIRSGVLPVTPSIDLTGASPV